MKTMFVAHENGAKKRFQKPNILRKKPKHPQKSTALVHESPILKQCEEENITHCTPCATKNPVQRLTEENIGHEEASIEELYQIDGNLDTDRSLAVTCEVLTNNNEENVFETTINVDVESFINTSDMEQMVSQADVDNARTQDWCLDFNNDGQEIIIEDIDGSHLGRLRLASPPTSATPVAAVTSSDELAQTNAVTTPNITLEYLNCTMNFKCDVPNCRKWFRSEQALSKHRSTHTKVVKVVNRSNKQVLIECPVKKFTNSGEEQPCGVFCSSKEEIVNHLNDCHDPEDAMYICSECGRRFYWAAALRSHARTHGAGSAGGAGGDKAQLVCAWAGCARAFRQPCRLREHMRTHTGDKPYPCRHPNCEWSFRTASKLMRHARRHTGERRHSCEQCGRAFRRREHLRDHAARHHLHKHACPHTGCDKKFNGLEKLYAHVEKEHKEEDAAAAEDIQETFTLSLDSPAVGSDVVSVETHASCGECAVEVREGDGTTDAVSARTHCTWPFVSRAPSPQHTFEEHANQYVLEEDVQVEMSEGSESNIYTIRSDLFLHGNVLSNEDSEQMCGATVGVAAGEGEGEGEGEGAGGGDADGEAEGGGVGLLDHPTIDLMQEELMYTDAAVDESSFRVFLLSGEDLS